ncbi:hypothetical protein SY89_01409 [Halolamina pelagica]|uniref:Uncharacterized protein n=1 Tax=Halolamina pelagica TaxID=699431 RepID=A0A0P7I1N7_9EURY|nr:hypothetical protein [Halolamina pelagica]KPN30673.1 hypothetical protein SY89_01409 [Halolamina pelagica]
MSEFKSFLADNPKMMGVLFTMLLFLSQAGSVAASAANTVAGP